jgi:hypothetical protein
VIIKEALRILAAPLVYLRARSEIKACWDFAIPLMTGAVAAWAYLLLPAGISLIGSKGIVPAVNSLLQILVGFYIAALAAVASLNSVALDQATIGDPVKLRKVMQDGVEEVVLNRRRLLSLMFSYLSFAAMFLYSSGVFAVIAADNLREIFPPVLLESMKVAFVSGYFSVLAQLACITTVTLYYLGDRMHRCDPVALPNQPASGAPDDARGEASSTRSSG